MEKLVIFLTIIYIISHTFLYRFQRTTLGISRRIRDRKLQATLTPNWITITYWINFILLIGLPVLIFIEFNWLWVLIFLIYSFIITPLIDIFLLPIPSYKSCFAIIKKGLQKDIRKSKDEARKLAFLQLLKAVENEEINNRK